MAIVFVLGLVALWQAASMLGWASETTAPAPTRVLAAGVELVRDDGVAYDVGVTVRYLLLAFVVAVVLGVLIGVLLASSALVAQVAEGFLTFLLGIPKSLFLPLFILVVGIGATQKVAFGVFSSFAVLVVATMAGLRGVDPALVRMATSLGATRRQMWVTVHLRSMVPTLVEAARIAMILNITGVLIAEIYVSREGLGYLIGVFGQTAQVDRLMAVILIVTAIGISLNELLRWVERRQDRWRGVTA